MLARAALNRTAERPIGEVKRALSQGQVVFNRHIIKAAHPMEDDVVCPAFGLHRNWLKEQALRLL